MLNKKRSIYLKRIDSLGKSSGFKELASIENDEATNDLRFEFKRVNENNLLIVGEKYYQNNTAKKMAILYDLQKNENIHQVKLPLENATTGYSHSFMSNGHLLYYFLSNQFVQGYRTLYTINQVLSIPIYITQKIQLTCYDLTENKISKSNICLQDNCEIKNSSISISNQRADVLIEYVDENSSGEKRDMFLIQSFEAALQKERYCKIVPMDTNIHSQLRYFDGGDKNGAEEKTFKPYQSYISEQMYFQINERSENNEYKELMLNKINFNEGRIDFQKLIPRKIFYFKDRMRFKNIQELALLQKNQSIFLFLIENRSNQKQTTINYNFHRYKKLKNLSGANLVCYEFLWDGEEKKTILYKNLIYNAVPLKYESNQTDFIFYLNKGNKEKFAILFL